MEMGMGSLLRATELFVLAVVAAVIVYFLYRFPLYYSILMPLSIR